MVELASILCGRKTGLAAANVAWGVGEGGRLPSREASVFVTRNALACLLAPAGASARALRELWA